MRRVLFPLLLAGCGIFGGGGESWKTPLAGSGHGLVSSLQKDKSLTSKDKPEDAVPTAVPASKFDEAIVRALAETHAYRSGTPQNPVVTPDGRAVLFLRAEARKPAQALFKLDIGTGHLTRL
jgi:hypothetical protein